MFAPYGVKSKSISWITSRNPLSTLSPKMKAFALLFRLLVGNLGKLQTSNYFAFIEPIGGKISLISKSPTCLIGLRSQMVCKNRQPGGFFQL